MLTTPARSDPAGAGGFECWLHSAGVVCAAGGFAVFNAQAVDSTNIQTWPACEAYPFGLNA
jgi:hypothetical protein